VKRLARENVTAATIVPIVVWLAAYFGFDVDETTATEIAGVVLVVLGFIARQRSTPVSDPRNNQGVPLVPAAVPPATTGPAG
jgi:hypothetical protein